MIDSFNPFSLKGKTIFVTGASSGIGRATAITCSRMGANVIASGRNKSHLNETLNTLEGIGHKTIVMDLTDEDQFAKFAGDCPMLDGVVHCAGIGDRTILKMVRKKDIDRVMSVNFIGPVLFQRELLRKKKIKQGASIVFIASRAPYAPAIGNGLYAASKGALIAYSKVLGLELANQAIRVNSICPAMVWTELIQRDAEVTGVDYRELGKTYPLKRLGQPEDIANLAVYLLSEASAWMTGSSIDITGGGEFTLN